MNHFFPEFAWPTRPRRVARFRSRLYHRGWPDLQGTNGLRSALAHTGANQETRAFPAWVCQVNGLRREALWFEWR